MKRRSLKKKSGLQRNWKIYCDDDDGALRWSILVGKQKHNVQKPICFCVLQTPVHCPGSSHVHDMNVALQLVNRRRVALARFWHNCLNKMAVTQSSFFDYAVRERSSFTSKCSIVKEKQKKHLNLLLTALFKNTQILKFKSQLTRELRFSLPSII